MQNQNMIPTSHKTAILHILRYDQVPCHVSRNTSGVSRTFSGVARSTGYSTCEHWEHAKEG